MNKYRLMRYQWMSSGAIYYLVEKKILFWWFPHSSKQWGASNGKIYCEKDAIEFYEHCACAHMKIKTKIRPIYSNFQLKNLNK
jgi:hypothetical protein